VQYDAYSLTTCTGWFASEQGHIVTAGHCVDPAIGRLDLIEATLDELGRPDLFADADANWTVQGPSNGSDILQDVYAFQPHNIDRPVVPDLTLVPILNFRTFEQGDLALLKLDGLREPAPALPIAAKKPEVRSEIESIGFAGTVSDLTDPPRDVPVFTPGTITSHRISSWGTPGASVSSPMSAGMSGGPTVDGQGNVVGINTYGGEGDFNFITDTEALIDYLDTQSVETVSPSGGPDGPVGGTPAPIQPDAGALAAPSQDSSLPGWLLPAGIGVGVVVLILLVVVGLLMSRNRSKVRPETASHGQQYGGPQQFSGSGQQLGTPQPPWPPAQQYQQQSWQQPTTQLDPSGEQLSQKFCQGCGAPNKVTATECSNCTRPFTD
jgi:hypothetical protein